MYSDDEEDTRKYRVVVNHEEQYSIWLYDKEIPLGWRDVGVHGQKAECLAHIKEVWTDMRPLSLRKAMEENEKKNREIREKLKQSKENQDPAKQEAS
ncbi:MAG: MbtH family NRPS accessory protein [Exilibacterium sp.]